MIRMLIAACTIAQLAGCVIVPTHVVPPPPTAAVGRIKVVVPQPDVGPHAMYVGEIPWHYARLTLAPLDGGSSPLVQTLASDRGDLVANGPIADLKPGAYNVRVELVQVGYDHAEHVVASGQLDNHQLKVGNGNSLELMVHPTELGSHVALTPTSLPRVSAPYWAGTTIIHETTIVDRPDETVEVRANEDDGPVLHVEDASDGWDDDADYGDGEDDAPASAEGDAPASADDDADDDDRR
jgi:hypothetical protein